MLLERRMVAMDILLVDLPLPLPLFLWVVVPWVVLVWRRVKVLVEEEEEGI